MPNVDGEQMTPDDCPGGHRDPLQAERDAVIEACGLQVYKMTPGIGSTMTITPESMKQQDAENRAQRDAALDTLIAKARLVAISEMPCLLAMGEPKYGDCLTRTEPLTMWRGGMDKLVTEPMGPEHYCSRCRLVAAALAAAGGKP